MIYELASGKYDVLQAEHCLFDYTRSPIAVDTRHLLDDLGRRSSLNSGEARKTSYLYQRISVLVQRFNAVLLHDSLPAADCTD